MNDIDIKWMNQLHSCLLEEPENQRLRIKVNEDEKVFLTSDTHFSSKRTFTLSKRDNVFNSIMSMDYKMINNIQKSLSCNKSVLIHLGDRGNLTNHETIPGYIYTNENEFVDNIKLANRRYLILGNYEETEMKEQGLHFEEFREKLIREEGWTDVFRKTAVLETPYNIKDEEGYDFSPILILLHDPYEFVKFTKFLTKKEIRNSDLMYCLFGHIHGRQMVKKFGIDVGVDAHNFMPISLEDCLFYLNAISQGFYDQSVFC